MTARLDLVRDPAVVADLATVRYGTAFFRRALNRLRDEELDGPSLLPGWSRRHVVAHVGYNARALARLVSWAATGVETPMYASPEARSREIDEGATLGPEALRHLAEHAAIDLDVRWRDLPADRWSVPVRTAQGREVPAAETVWLRSREVWLHAVDLHAGAAMHQVPAVVLRRIVDDVWRAWVARGTEPGFALAAADTDAAWGSPAGGVITAPLAELASWATGRLPAAEAGGLDWSGAGPVAAPHWI